MIATISFPILYLKRKHVYTQNYNFTIHIKGM